MLTTALAAAVQRAMNEGIPLASTKLNELCVDAYFSLDIQPSVETLVHWNTKDAGNNSLLRGESLTYSITDAEEKREVFYCPFRAPIRFLCAGQFVVGIGSTRGPTTLWPVFQSRQYLSSLFYCKQRPA